jgi:hypothetical protein
VKLTELRMKVTSPYECESVDWIELLMQGFSYYIMNLWLVEQQHVTGRHHTTETYRGRDGKATYT